MQSVLEIVTTPFAYKTPYKASVLSLMNEALEITTLGLCQAHSVLKANQNVSVFHSLSKIYIKEWKGNAKHGECV